RADGVGDGAPDRQHDGAAGGGCDRGPLIRDPVEAWRRFEDRAPCKKKARPQRARLRVHRGMPPKKRQVIQDSAFKSVQGLKTLATGNQGVC
ncbi:hypothetical protein P0D73_43170, partial [Paraburkholderia sp. RL18-101-BIB-B]|uniref:hypothetical protein n=1 Tax=Paraburkholderia sp. RL18-101-BIB-B TaxID=3031634 RepID=UPI0038B7B8A9